MPAAASASVAASAVSLMAMARRSAAISSASLFRRMREMAAWASSDAGGGEGGAERLGLEDAHALALDADAAGREAGGERGEGVP